MLITEKGVQLSHENRYMLEVALDANKLEIKDAVEKYFGVHVLAVRTQRHKGAMRTLKNRRVAHERNWKRAIVTLRPGERIESLV